MNLNALGANLSKFNFGALQGIRAQQRPQAIQQREPSFASMNVKGNLMNPAVANANLGSRLNCKG